MESKRGMLNLAETPTGTKVSFYFHQLVAETEDEMKCLADIRALETTQRRLCFSQPSEKR
jgi:hypothetical protein